jgi:hypothetical protein
MWWNSMNGWNGLAFVGWQAGLTTDNYGGYTAGFSLNPGLGNTTNNVYTWNPGYFPGNMFSDFLNSGNSIAWNTWNFLNIYYTEEPPRGYVPIFSDLPELRQLLIGACIQTQPTNMAYVAFGPHGYFLGNQSAGDDQRVNFAINITTQFPIQSYFNVFPPTQYDRPVIAISQWGDMAEGMPGKQLAAGQGFYPSGIIIDWDHRGALTPFTPPPPPPGVPPISGPCYLGQWDQSWLQELTQPFIIQPGEWPVEGQVMPITPYGHVPFGWSNPYLGTIFWNWWQELQYYAMMPFGALIGYFIPPGVAFATAAIGGGGAPGGVFYNGVQLDPPTEPIWPSDLTTTLPPALGLPTDPPGVVYGAYGSVFDYHVNPSPFYVTGFGLDYASGRFPANSFVRTSTGQTNTLVFMQVPWDGPNLYISSTGFYGNLWTGGFQNNFWHIVQQTFP